MCTAAPKAARRGAAAPATARHPLLVPRIAGAGRKRKTPAGRQRADFNIRGLRRKADRSCASRADRTRAGPPPLDCGADEDRRPPRPRRDAAARRALARAHRSPASASSSRRRKRASRRSGRACRPASRRTSSPARSTTKAGRCSPRTAPSPPSCASSSRCSSARWPRPAGRRARCASRCSGDDGARRRVRPHARVPGRQGHRPRRVRGALPRRLQHRRLAAVRRRVERAEHRPVLHARALRGARRRCARRAGSRRSSPACARSSAWKPSCTRWRRAPRLLLMVSKHGHCLNDLLFRWHAGQLAGRHRGVVSNHPDFAALARSFGLAVPPLPARRRRAAPKPSARRSCRSRRCVERAASTSSCWRATCRS